MRMKNVRDEFLKYLGDLFSQNTSLSINTDTIYGELTNNYFDNDLIRVNPISLVGVQAKLSNKFRNNKKVNTFIKSNYWIIENRNKLNDIKFYNNIKNGYKIYIFVDSNILYNLAESLFNYMIHENILMQCKISNTMRSDSLICRLSDVESVVKINEYLGGTKYNYAFKLNPFMFNLDNVSIAKDNYLNYNYTLSKLLSKYYSDKRINKDFNNIDSKDFIFFLTSQRDILKSTNKKELVQLYSLSDKKVYDEFLYIVDLLSIIFNDNSSFIDLQNVKFVSSVTNSNKCYFAKEYEDKIKFCLNFMEQKYGIDAMHMRILCFLRTGNYNLFTRDGNVNDKGEFISVRSVLKDNFTKDDLKKIISNMGWQALVKVSKSTYNKYGEEQLKTAIDNLYNKGNLSNFTNDNNLRSYLGLIIPYTLLKDVIDSKCKDNNMDVNVNSIYSLIINSK